jgi:putative ABC transport system substrate-binding protein
VTAGVAVVIKTLAMLALALSGVSVGAIAAGAAEVAVLLGARVDAYQEALRGFKATVRHDVVAEYDMRGDRERGRRILSEIEEKLQPDLILAVGVWALESVLDEKPKIPVVYTMVLNPASVIGGTSQQITGSSMNVSVEKVLEIFGDLDPQIRRVGTVYDRRNTGYLVGTAKEVADSKGLEVVAREIHSPGEAVSALDALQTDGIDALWILPDHTVLFPAVVEHMILSSIRMKIPLLGLSPRQAQMGALVSVYFASSEDIGRQAGELTNQVLERESPSQVPYTMARNVGLTVNLRTARRIGVDVPQNIRLMATELIQ